MTHGYFLTKTNPQTPVCKVHLRMPSGLYFWMKICVSELARLRQGSWLKRGQATSIPPALLKPGKVPLVCPAMIRSPEESSETPGKYNTNMYSGLSEMSAAHSFPTRILSLWFSGRQALARLEMDIQR